MLKSQFERYFLADTVVHPVLLRYAIDVDRFYCLPLIPICKVMINYFPTKNNVFTRMILFKMLSNCVIGVADLIMFVHSLKDWAKCFSDVDLAADFTINLVYHIFL